MQFKRTTNRYLASLLYKRILEINIDKPIVSFTFDDFPSSAMLGAQLLNEYHKKGTFYVSCGLMNTRFDNILQCNEKDIENLVLTEHELGCHTYDHLNANEVLANHYENSILKNKRFIQENFAIELKSFSYPYGAVSPFTKKIANSHYNSCRSVIPGINYGTVDVSLLKANRLYSNSITLERCKELIDMNNHYKGWLIFYTHDISNNPSQYGCTLDYFQKVVDFASNTSEILTMTEALNVIHNQQSR